jgi:hypothetical protein
MTKLVASGFWRFSVPPDWTQYTNSCGIAFVASVLWATGYCGVRLGFDSTI